MSDTKRVYRRLAALQEHGPKKGQRLRIPVTQPENVLKDPNATVGIGDSYGDLTIVWLDGDDTAYLECRQIEGVLFIMYETEFSHQLGRLSQDKFYATGVRRHQRRGLTTGCSDRKGGKR